MSEACELRKLDQRKKKKPTMVRGTRQIMSKTRELKKLDSHEKKPTMGGIR